MTKNKRNANNKKLMEQQAAEGAKRKAEQMRLKKEADEKRRSIRVDKPDAPPPKPTSKTPPQPPRAPKAPTRHPSPPSDEPPSKRRDTEKKSAFDTEDEDEEDEGKEDEIDRPDLSRFEIAVPTKAKPFPLPGLMPIPRINPNLDTDGIAPTAYLPYELQLWWQLNAQFYVSSINAKNWMMATIIPDKFNTGTYQEVKSCLSFVSKSVEEIVGPGNGRFFLVQGKNSNSKDILSRSASVDRGVLVHLGEPKRTTALVFNLPVIDSNTPEMSSLLVAYKGGPPSNLKALFPNLLVKNIMAVHENQKLKLDRARYPNDVLTTLPTGETIIEMNFDLEGASAMMRMLSGPGLVRVRGWNRRGDNADYTQNLSLRFLPLCPSCGVTTACNSHSNCPYLAIRDDLVNAISRPRGVSKKRSSISIAPSLSAPEDSTLDSGAPTPRSSISQRVTPKVATNVFGEELID